MALDGSLEPDRDQHPLSEQAWPDMARRGADAAALEARLGHAFSDRELLTEALTHVSRSGGGPTYQRLEFLGDRVLGLSVAAILMEAFPQASEGDLSRRFSELVRRETCAEVAQVWDLGPHLKVGGSGAMRRNVSILADACEAVIGAVFLDGGFEAARALVARAFGDHLQAQVDPPSNPKTRLQEWAASRGRPPPTYVIVGRSGPDHAPHFEVAARVRDLDEAIGTGGSRRAAEQAAAQAILVREGLVAAESPAAERAAVESQDAEHADV